MQMWQYNLNLVHQACSAILGVAVCWQGPSALVLSLRINLHVRETDRGKYATSW